MAMASNSNMNMDLRPRKRKMKTSIQEEKERDINVKESSLSLLSSVVDEVLIEILIRLRCCKFVNQCKLVCKRWNSIISSPFFNSQAAFNSFTLVFQIRYDSRNYPILSFSNLPIMSTTQTNSDSILHHLNLDFLALPSPKFPSMDNSLIVAATCHDLLLLSQYNTRYYVVNPVTRQWITLPPTPSSCHRGGNAFRSGLLCHYSNPNCNTYSFRFKVIRVPFIPTYRIEKDGTFPFPASYKCDSPEFSIFIFCSVSNQWTEYCVNWYPFRFTHYLTRTPIVSHNGMLHWLNGCSLVSFNPFAINFDDGDRVRLSRTIDLPEDFPHDSVVPGAHRLNLVGIRVNLLGFGVTGAHLRVITEHQVDERYLCVWELEERENKAGVWRLAYKVLVSELPLKEKVMKCRLDFVAFHPYDADVLFLKGLQFIYQINLRTRTSMSFQIPRPPFAYCYLVRAVPPLLHQLFPTPPTTPPPDSPAVATCLRQF